jgi:hypothetical protein
VSEPVYFITLGLFFGTIVIVFGMRYVSLGLQARARLASEAADRQFAERMAADQAASLSALTRIEQTLGDLAPRVTAVEAMLREVG